jgi:serine/threonine protein kinase
VFLASLADDQYRKQVAIKVIHPMLDSDVFVQRFKTERQILANLDHPNIARLLDGGTTNEGSPYLVMEYIEGLPIDVYCDTRALSIDDRLKLFQTVCSAVQYAHQHLVVHRDIKTANILVTEDGIPKLLDFGIASSQSVLGNCLRRSKKFQEAEPLLLTGYDRLKAALGSNHERIKEARLRVLKLYQDWNKLEKAQQFGELNKT